MTILEEFAVRQSLRAGLLMLGVLAAVLYAAIYCYRGPSKAKTLVKSVPLLSFADAWNFSAPPRFTGWNITQFKHFHCRARAIIQGSHASSRIAAGV